MLDRLIRAFLVVGGGSVASAWTWPGAFPATDPVAVLVPTTPRMCTAPSSRGTTWCPAWPCSWPGNFSSAHRGIWFARMGVRVGRRSRLPRSPLSPTADGPAIVVGEVHHPVRAIESPAPNG